MNPYSLFVKDEAIKEIQYTFDWYENQTKNLENKFISALDLCFETIQSNPKIFQKTYKNFRQANVPVFPFVVI